MPTFGQVSTDSTRYVDDEGNPVQGAVYTLPDGSLRWAHAVDAQGNISAIKQGPEQSANVAQGGGGSQTIAQQALVQLQRPDWKAVSPITDTDPTTGKKTYVWTIVGPTGQPDSMTIDDSGNIILGPKNTPEKPPAAVKPPPSATEALDPVNDASGKQIGWRDKTTGQTTLFPAGSQPKEPTPISDYEKASLKLQQDRDARAAEAQKATESAENLRTQLQASMQDWTQQYQAGQLSEAQYRDNLTAANQQAQQELDRATIAVTSARDAQNALYQQQQADTSKAAQAETTRSNQARETQTAGGAAETARANVAGEQQQGAQTGAGLLNTRVNAGSGMMNNLMSIAGSNKNFGLGGPLPAGLGQGLMSDVGGFATGLGGGQGVYDTAASLIHQADPKIAGTAQGAAYTSVLTQMLQHQQAQQGGGGGGAQQEAQAPTASMGNFSPAPTRHPGGGDIPGGGGGPSTTIAPDGTITVQHVSPQNDPNADQTQIRGFR